MVFLTPSVQRLLDQVNSGPPPDQSPEAQRAGLAGAMTALGWPSGSDHAGVVELPSGASVHLFQPSGPPLGRVPTIAYLHGGSFVAGGAGTHGGVAQALADAAAAVVALIAYRLTPEHALPAALEDAIAGVRALAAVRNRFNLDLTRLSIVGDSAGGWLAAQTALELSESADTAITRLVLVNPMISPRPGRTEDRAAFAEGYFATTADFDGAWLLAGTWIEGDVHPDAATVERLAKLPPTVVITNEVDPVRDEGEFFAERLSQAGVPVVMLRTRGLIHAAWLFPKVLPEAPLLLEMIAGAAVSRINT